MLDKQHIRQMSSVFLPLQLKTWISVSHEMLINKQCFVMVTCLQYSCTKMAHLSMSPSAQPLFVFVSQPFSDIIGVAYKYCLIRRFYFFNCTEQKWNFLSRLFNFFPEQPYPMQHRYVHRSAYMQPQESTSYQE